MLKKGSAPLDQARKITEFLIKPKIIMFEKKINLFAMGLVLIQENCKFVAGDELSGNSSQLARIVELQYANKSKLVRHKHLPTNMIDNFSLTISPNASPMYTGFYKIETPPIVLYLCGVVETLPSASVRIFHDTFDNALIEEIENKLDITNSSIKLSTFMISQQSQGKYPCQSAKESVSNSLKAHNIRRRTSVLQSEANNLILDFRKVLTCGHSKDGMIITEKTLEFLIKNYFHDKNLLSMIETLKKSSNDFRNLSTIFYVDRSDMRFHLVKLNVDTSEQSYLWIAYGSVSFAVFFFTLYSFVSNDKFREYLLSVRLSPHGNLESFSKESIKPTTKNDEEGGISESANVAPPEEKTLDQPNVIDTISAANSYISNDLESDNNIFSIFTDPISVKSSFKSLHSFTESLSNIGNKAEELGKNFRQLVRENDRVKECSIWSEGTSERPTFGSFEDINSKPFRIKIKVDNEADKSEEIELEKVSIKNPRYFDILVSCGIEVAKKIDVQRINVSSNGSFARLLSIGKAAISCGEKAYVCGEKT